MRIQAYTRYSGLLTITCSTLRPEAAPSVKFQAATVHEDFSGLVCGLMEEHKHVAPTDAFFPAAQRMQGYFPGDSTGAAIYALKQIRPDGAPRDIDLQFMLEITRLRYEFVLDLSPAAFSVSGTVRNGIMRAMEFAASQLLVNNGVPLVFIPGDDGLRPANADSTVVPTEVDIVCEIGPASVRQGVDIPDPIASPGTA